MGTRKQGIVLVLAGGTMWGGSGVAAQYLFQHAGISPEWLVVVRLILSGMILLAIDAARNRGDIFSIFGNGRDVGELIFFGLFGMLAVQYTYFVAIEASNAAAATILQYLMPVLIVFWTSFRTRTLPTLLEVICILLAMLGTFFLVTHGDFRALVVSERAVIWGLLSALAAAIYTISPRRLIHAYRAPLVIGWGMFLGGCGVSFFFSPWDFLGTWTELALWNFAYIILFGTVLAFWAYLGSLKYLQPSEAGTLACVEPLAAILFSVALLGVRFVWMDLVGAAFIVGAVVLLVRRT